MGFQQPFSSPSSDLINLIISVEDTGTGIPWEPQSRVFTPFMQVCPSISRIHGGTGIGLSISKCLVGPMKGEIGFVSEPQIGSTFTFTAVFSKACNKTKEYEASKFKGMKALVVDHRPTRAKVTKYHLQRLEIHSETALGINHLSPRITNGSLTVEMILVDKDMWMKAADLWPVLMSVLKKADSSKIPEVFLLANPSCDTKNNSVNSMKYITSVITKPLRAIMLDVSLRQAMGSMEKDISRNGGKPSLSLQTLLYGRKILVVDDNIVNLRVAAGALKKYGAQVTCVESGKKAIDMLKPPHKFDACFMDIQMPEMDGFEATRIREMEKYVFESIKCGESTLEAYGNVLQWHTPIFPMTADVIQATNEVCEKFGMDGYVSKPFEGEQLYGEVERFFNSTSHQTNEEN